MKRDTLLGIDPSEKTVFAFLFEKDQKVLSLFAKYTDESNEPIAKQFIALEANFWKQGATILDIKTRFEQDMNQMALDVEFWVEIMKD